MSRNVLLSFFRWHKQTGQVVVNGIAVCFFEIFFLLSQSPLLSFILLYLLRGESRSCLCSKSISGIHFSKWFNALANPRPMLYLAPMSHYFCWKLLLSESVNYKQGEKDTEQAVESTKIFDPSCFMCIPGNISAVSVLDSVLGAILVSSQVLQKQNGKIWQARNGHTSYVKNLHEELVFLVPA